MRTTDLIWPLIPWAVVNLFLLGLTTLVWRRLRLHSRWIDPLIFGFLFLFDTTAFVMICALAGMLRPVPISFVGAVGCAALVWYFRVDVRQWIKDTQNLLASLRQRRLTDLRIEGLFAAVALAIAVRIAFHVWYLPPYVRDTLTYHLPKVAQWARSGSLVIFDTPVDRTFWPANFELFQTWFVLFPHHDFLIELACVAFYALACASVYTIARCLDLDRRWSMAAALIYGLTPAPLQHATSSKNDMPIAALYLFLVALLLEAKKRWSFPRRRLFIALLAFCLALGMKPYIVFIAPGLAVMAFWSARGKPWKTLLEEGEAADRASPGLALTGALVAAAFMLAGYWFLRNGLVFGNPFYPATPRIFGEYLFDTQPGSWERQGVMLSFEALKENLKTFLTEKVFDRNEYHFSLADMTGWGWFAFVCGWPTLVYGCLISARVRWLGAAFSLSFLCLLACVVSDPWYMRFAQWFPALFAISFLLVMKQLRVSFVRHGLTALAAVCLLLNFVGTLDIGKLPPWMWLRMSAIPVAERSTAALGLFIGRGYYDALRTIPRGEAIGYNTNYNGWIYPLYDADYSRDVRYVPITPETDVVLELRRREVRYLFLSLPPPEVRVRLDQTLRQGGLRKIGEDLYVIRD